MITLKTLPQATAQEVFDQVVTHLRNQGEKSVAKDGSCMYRGIQNTKCAAGCLIADDEYQPGMEGKSWKDLKREYIIVPTSHSEIIDELQEVHDLSDIEFWEVGLKEIAQKHNLIYNGTNK